MILADKTMTGLLDPLAKFVDQRTANASAAAGAQVQRQIDRTLEKATQAAETAGIVLALVLVAGGATWWVIKRGKRKGRR